MKINGHERIAKLHLILMLVIIILDSVALSERVPNLVGDHIPKPTRLMAIGVPFLASLFLFVQTNFGGKAVAYRPILRHGTKVLFGCTTLTAIFFSIPARHAPTDLPILISDIDDYTNDQLFSEIGSRRLLTRALQQSPSIAVFPDDKLEDVLQRMKKPRQSRLTSDTGNEICIREGIGPLVTWNATESEGRYSLKARISNPQDGAVLRDVAYGAFGPGEIVSSIGYLAGKLREAFGDPYWDVYTSKPLMAATTSSLPALRAYTKAQDYLQERNYPQAEQNLLKAVDLDSDFALALVELASLYEGSDKGRAIVCSTRAFEHSGALTEPERVRVEEYYYWLVMNDHERAFKEVSDFIKKYPKNHDRVGTLAYQASILMKFELAEDLN